MASSSLRSSVSALLFAVVVFVIVSMMHYANTITHQHTSDVMARSSSMILKRQRSLWSPNSNNGVSGNDDDDNGDEVIDEDGMAIDGEDFLITSRAPRARSDVGVDAVAPRQQQSSVGIVTGGDRSLDSVIMNELAYSLAARWWNGKDADVFHESLVETANRVLADASRNQHTVECSADIKHRYFYTHRKPRPKELSNLEMARISKAEATKAVVIGEPLHRVVNPRPVVLNDTFDLVRRRFGNWHVTFVPDPADARSSPQRLPAEPAMSVSLFSHGVVSAGNVVSCDGSMFSAGGCLWEGVGKNVLNHHPREARNIIAVSLCDGWCRGYYHFSHEHLPRISLVYDLLIHSPHARLVLSHSPVGYAKQFFTDILGIPKDRIMVVGGGGVRAGVVALPTPMRCGNAFTSALVGLQRLVLAKLVPHHSHHQRHAHAAAGKPMDEFVDNAPTLRDGKLRILFAERSHLSRMPRNYDELKKHVMQTFEDVASFEETQGREHAREQVLRFFYADIVVGPHGANLANIMFMRPGRHVIEMASAKNGNLCYYSTAMRMNLTHHLVLHDKGKDSHYVLPKEILVKHIALAVKQIRFMLS